MSDMAKDSRTFTILFVTAAALALGGALWLGWDGRVPVDMTADGEVTRSASVLVLWFAPALTLVLWGLALPGAVWGSRKIAEAQAEGRGEDAVLGLARHRSALRVYASGLTLIQIAMQLFVLARAADIARPLGLDRDSFVRIAFILGGLLFAYLGNVWPKLPYTPNRGIDAARHHKANRFFGLMFTIGGVALCAVAVVTPLDLISWVSWPITLTMIVVPLIRYVQLAFDYQREIRSGGCGPT